MALSSTVTVSIDEIKAGASCSYPIEGECGVLLLGADTKITPHVINGLRERGITSIEVHPSDLAKLRGSGSNPRAKALPRKEKPSNPTGRWISSQPVKDLLVDRHDEDLSDERTQTLKRGMGTAKAQYERMQKLLGSSELDSISDLTSVSEVYARMMVDDHDQTVGIMGSSSPIDDIAERSVRMAVIGMAIGIEMGLDGEKTTEIGMAALLHDVGIYAMDGRFQEATRALDPSEHWEFQKHPLLSARVAQDFMEIPHSVLLAIAQVHEQFDGSGYPRGTKGQRIHLYARILNVVDAYLTLTAPAATRQAIVPHDALGLMLHQAGRGLFDPQVMRAFVNTETMFPLGSMVELKNGELAQVIRRPKAGFAAPVLLGSDGKRIELESTSLEIARPVCDPMINQMRLTPQRMKNAKWCSETHTFLIV